uniref:Uncharacterized protein n=1 Tax=Physcomitrium patens TaxID=3218 RepID=A0A2K1JC82_PHYPA|nr:hypothetical protein PHYPA_019418 [Physcomitrium patens]
MTGQTNITHPSTSKFGPSLTASLSTTKMIIRNEPPQFLRNKDHTFMGQPVFKGPRCAPSIPESTVWLASCVLKIHSYLQRSRILKYENHTDCEMHPLELR